jgi:hypothetical protein
MAPDRQQRPPGYFLGWDIFAAGFVPGLLHFRLGRSRLAALAIGGCALVFVAGWLLVRDRLFFYALVQPDRGTALAGVFRFLPVMNLPEMLNLPFTAAASVFGYEPGFPAERLWRLPREHESIGSWLTAASGMLAAFWSADAHWRLRRQQLAEELQALPAKINPAVAAGLSWLVPGLGHVKAGQKDKGLLMGAAVLLVFAAGVVAAAGHAVDRGISPVWWIGQDLFGGGTLLCALLFDRPMTGEIPGLDLGVILCTVAGFMNLVVMVDAYTVAERSAEVSAPAPTGGTP